MSPRQLQLPNFVRGKAGETRAIDFLKQKGYQVVDLNVRIANCEVDIIALDSSTDELVFCEVKYRQTDEFGSPSTAVSAKKLQSLKRVAAQFRRQHNLKQDFRFDILAVLPDTIHHYENVTWHSTR